MALRRYTPMKPSSGTRIPDAIRRNVILRDAGCVGPRVGMPTDCTLGVELDHVRASGGLGMKSPSTAENLVSLCPSHHRMRTIEGRRWRPRLLGYLEGAGWISADPEIGPTRYCRRCEEWWPDDDEFWKTEHRPTGAVVKVRGKVYRRPRAYTIRRCLACSRATARRFRERFPSRVVLGPCPCANCGRLLVSDNGRTWRTPGGRVHRCAADYNIRAGSSSTQTDNLANAVRPARPRADGVPRLEV